MTVRVGVPVETAGRERRVALVPEGVRVLTKAGVEVHVEAGAGARAYFPDAAYRAAGATIVDARTDLWHDCDVLVKVQRPFVDEVAQLREGATVVSLFAGDDSEAVLGALKARGVAALALERVPRITRAQSMDVLSSQATVAGYKAVLLAASEVPKLLPMLTTAAGSLAPAKAFIIGAGVAGLQAIATARRLGAVVSAFDVRAATREQVQSLGASFVAADAVAPDAEAAGGYARAQTDIEQQRTAALIANHIREMDIVIATAQVPGKPAPRLISTQMVQSMRAGAVIIDLAAESGGNCDLTRPGETVEENGVKVIGPINVPSTVPLHASQMFSKNMVTVLQHLIPASSGALTLDPTDEITGAMLVTSLPGLSSPAPFPSPS